MNDFYKLRNEALQLGLSKGEKGVFKFPSSLVLNYTEIKEVNCITGDIICNNRIILGGVDNNPITRTVFNKIIETLKP
jgi:hypothetical protein